MHWKEIFFQFDEPTSRLYHLNLLVCLGLIGVIYLQKHRNSSFIDFIKKTVFNTNYWWNRSSRQDYFLFLTNGLLKVLFFIPLLECTFWIAHKTTSILSFSFPNFEALPTSTAFLILATLLAFIWDDFLRFLHHYCSHKSSLLWELHKTHHSARVLNPITLYRSHPLEAACSVVRNSLSLGVSSGVYVFAFNSPFDLWTILGVNAFGFTFNLLGTNLRHSQISLSFGNLEYLFISPLQHQIHHSRLPEHHHKNYGVSLAIWDLLLGSLMISKNVHNLKFGLNEKFRSSTTDLILEPFKKVLKSKI